VDAFEMESILADKNLLDRLKKGHAQAQKNRGRFVD
jgi:hypothetical protein